ncbi:glycoside hydrolase family 47 protein [Mycena floridula]|nr:glycoside hydrolase family 47 protein [Mycena floridula]
MLFWPRYNVLPPSAELNRQTVTDIFKVSYNAYRQYAWGQDDLSPISMRFSNRRNGWGATIVDALTTEHIMGLDVDYFDQGVEFASKIDFSGSKTQDTVSVFETTIRYLASLLSAHQMTNNTALLNKAVELADKLAFAWVHNNDIPFSHIDFTSNKPEITFSNIAEAGTLILEWATLSKLTGNATYGKLAEKSMRRIAKNASLLLSPPPLPGLPAQEIDPSSGGAIGAYVTWSGGSDSYFEYLIKYARLTNTDDSFFVCQWLTAVDSSIPTLLKKSTVGNHTYLADIRHLSSHLACFHGGNWLLGGKLTDNNTIVKIALELVDACWNTYNSTATGIGPETFAFEGPDGSFAGMGPPTPEQQEFHKLHGFYITSSSYILRPEVLESNFYAWRVTGDKKYWNRAVDAIESFNEYLYTANGYVGLEDVNNVESGKIDDEESFWFAEVLKYLFLTFDDPEHISLDKYVFNTEAHPFIAPPANKSYAPAKC